MANVLPHTAEEPVIVGAAAARLLLDRGDGDAALLYLALLCHHGTRPPRSLAGELRWPPERLEAAERTLQGLKLIVTDPAADASASAEEPVLDSDAAPVYQQTDVADWLENSEDFRGLVDQTERLLGKKLSTQDLERLLRLYDHARLPADVILLLVNHCMERAERRYGEGRRPFLYQIEKEGYTWARRGVDSQAAANDYLKRYALRRQAFSAYMRELRLGDRLPVPSEEKFMASWQEMGFPPEAVALAYDKTVLRMQKFQWGYCNGILRRWHKAGLHTVEEIEEGDRLGGARRQSGGSSVSITEEEMRRYVQEQNRRP